MMNIIMSIMYCTFAFVLRKYLEPLRFVSNTPFLQGNETMKLVASHAPTDRNYIMIHNSRISQILLYECSLSLSLSLS